MNILYGFMQMARGRVGMCAVGMVEVKDWCEAWSYAGNTNNWKKERLMKERRRE